MSSGAIALVGASGSGDINVSLMTVGFTESKDIDQYGFSRQPWPVFSDEGTPEIGDLAPATVAVGGVNYSVYALNWASSNVLKFVVLDDAQSLSVSSVTSIATSQGTYTLSGATFSSVNQEGSNYSQWLLTTENNYFNFAEDTQTNVTFTAV